jgi:hypothetical protein
MDTLMKADIFFFVATIQSVIVTLLLCIVLYYVIKIVRTLKLITEELQARVEDSEEFVAELRKRLEGNFIFRFLFPPVAPPKKKRKAKKKVSTDAS